MAEVLRMRKAVPDIQSIQLEADIGPMRVFDAMFACNSVLTERFVPYTDRVGVYGDWRRVKRELAEQFMHDHNRGYIFERGGKAPNSFSLCGINWHNDPRVGPHFIAAWHPMAIIPPVTVLRREAIVYCTLTER